MPATWESHSGGGDAVVAKDVGVEKGSPSDMPAGKVELG